MACDSGRDGWRVKTGVTAECAWSGNHHSGAPKQEVAKEISDGSLKIQPSPLPTEVLPVFVVKHSVK